MTIVMLVVEYPTVKCRTAIKFLFLYFKLSTVFLGGKFWIYPTVFTPHIYFIILISMIAGNLVEIIRLPQIQNRKCLRKSNIWRYRAEKISSEV